MPRRQEQDLTGQRFYSLVAGERVEGKRQTINCRCDCGRAVVAWVSNLTKGFHKTCGSAACRAKWEKPTDSRNGVVRTTVLERGQAATFR